MFPFDKRDRRPRTPSFFGEFEDFFREFDSYATTAMTEAENAPGRSFFYGFSSYTGQDGKPIVNEYTNIPGFKGAPLAPDGQKATAQIAGEENRCELFHDVLDEGDKVKVIVDLPGVEKKDIKIQSHGRSISINATGAARNYQGDIELPAVVSKKPSKATYVNGVLEVTYKKEQEKAGVKGE